MSGKILIRITGSSEETVNRRFDDRFEDHLYRGDSVGYNER